MLGKIVGCVVVASLCLAAGPAASLRGKLVQPEGKAPSIETGAGRVMIEGEPETMSVLNDSRLAGSEMELLGRFKGPGTFAVGSFYTTKSMFVLKDGKKYTISYWCPVCSIRTHTPGKCMCCQQETHLDLTEEK